ncbi:MAG: hypothetical protein RIQ79_1571, partial [Verrucomicrobiota bacterium]
VATTTAAPLTAESRLMAATVYPDRAVVTRVAKVTLPAGGVEVVFAGLPAGLMDESVQVSARGTVAATLLDITTRTVFTADEPDARLKALEDRLATLRREGQALTDRAGVLEAQRGLVQSIEKAETTPVAAPTGTTSPVRPSLEDYAKLLAFSAEQRARLNSDTQKLDLECTALNEKISATEAQLKELRGQPSGRRATKAVTIRLAAPSAGSVELSLAYALPGARWTPAYDARLRSTERQVQLDAFGLVRNSTGEDWNGVALTLSTARPGLGGAEPEIGAWYVDLLHPEQVSASQSFSLFGSKKPKRPDPSVTVIGQHGFLNPTDASFSAANASLDEGDYLRGAEAFLESAATSASFRIATSVTLASDNTSQRVPLGSAVFVATLQYQATPKLQETAFLAAYVTNTSELPFLGGALNVFLDDTFVATARLATTMPGEKLTLNLGADEGVAIKRKIVSRFTEDTGFTTKSRRTSYDILVTVTNNKRTPERVVIKDAVPVPRDEKILVKLLAPAERELLKPEDAAAQPPKVGIARDADGKLTWRLDLKPGEKRELPLRFSIEHPADLSVSGVE